MGRSAATLFLASECLILELSAEGKLRAILPAPSYIARSEECRTPVVQFISRLQNVSQNQRLISGGWGWTRTPGDGTIGQRIIFSAYRIEVVRTKSQQATGSSEEWTARPLAKDDRAVMAKKKNEADRDTAPRLPISVCINVGADGKLSAVRVSPEAAAKISRVKGFPHYDLSPEEKRDKLRKLLDYDYSRLIRRGIVKQMTHFNPLASTYFLHMWAVPAGGKRTPHELFHDSEKLPWVMGKRNKLRGRSKRELKEESDLPNISGDYLPPSVLTKSSVQKALRTYPGTQGVSNFSPVQASAIHDKFLPKQGGAVFDPSCGWRAGCWEP